MILLLSCQLIKNQSKLVCWSIFWHLDWFFCSDTAINMIFKLGSFLGLTFLFRDLRWARSTYSFFFAMNDDIDEPSFLQSRPSSHTLHLVTFGCYNPHCVTWCHFCKKIEKKSVWKKMKFYLKLKRTYLLRSNCNLQV